MPEEMVMVMEIADRSGRWSMVDGRWWISDLELERWRTLERHPTTLIWCAIDSVISLIWDVVTLHWHTLCLPLDALPLCLYGNGWWTATSTATGA